MKICVVSDSHDRAPMLASAVADYPHYGRAIACTGDYNVVCCGHDHAASVVRQPNVLGGSTWLVNPGTVAGLGGPATCLLADLSTAVFEIRDLAG